MSPEEFVTKRVGSLHTLVPASLVVDLLEEYRTLPSARPDHRTEPGVPLGTSPAPVKSIAVRAAEKRSKRLFSGWLLR